MLLVKGTVRKSHRQLTNQVYEMFSSLLKIKHTFIFQTEMSRHLQSA